MPGVTGRTTAPPNRTTGEAARVRPSRQYQRVTLLRDSSGLVSQEHFLHRTLASPRLPVDGNNSMSASEEYLPQRSGLPPLTRAWANLVTLTFRALGRNQFAINTTWMHHKPMF